MGQAGAVLVAKDWPDEKTDGGNGKSGFKWMEKGGEKWKNGQGRVGNRAEEGVAGETWHGWVEKFYLPPPLRDPPLEGGFWPEWPGRGGGKGGLAGKPDQIEIKIIIT